MSTSSYQIEGAVAADGRGPSIWDIHCLKKGRIANGDTGEIACDHYNRWPEDIALMRRLGVGAYRFSIAWPRVLPAGRGAVAEGGLAFYDRLVDGLLEAGIEPWPCLYHWDLPQALDELGGWTARDTAGRFADYAALLARRLGDRAKRWATFNEPSVFTIFGYALGWNAPGVADRAAYLRAVHHVNLAHGGAVDALRAHVPGASIGAIHNLQPCVPESPGPADVAAAETLDAHWNRMFPDAQILGHYPPSIAREFESVARAGDMAAICRPVDWFGVNHYSPIHAKADPASALGVGWGKAPEDAPRSGIGWHVHPEAFADVLLRAQREWKLPIYVLENGFGDVETLDPAGRAPDPKRCAYLAAYVAAMRSAIARGADVRGYFVWSLLDNFEWGAGYANRFGLVHVDFPTQRRIPKDSFAWYADLIRRSR